MTATEMILAGLDGANPLAFLAALGTLRTLDAAWPTRHVRLAWRVHGRWTPVLHVEDACEPGELITALHEQLKRMDGHPALSLSVEPGSAPKDDLKLSGEEFRALARRAAALFLEERERTTADFAAAFGCEAVLTKDGLVEDTALRTMSGAGHQHFLEFMRQLVSGTTEEHLRHALFEPWSYADPGPSLRWDPEDDRRYALRWREPSSDPIRTVRGANRLAIEALPLLPTAPQHDKLATTGFDRLGTRQIFWTWPIWSPPVSRDVAASLLSLGDLQKEEPPREELAALGVVEIYRSQRVTAGKYRSFTPARPPGRSAER
jgi:hypothetical protein